MFLEDALPQLWVSTHVFTRCRTHANESPQCGFLIKEEVREELQRWGGEIFLTSQQDVWRGWRQLVNRTFLSHFALEVFVCFFCHSKRCCSCACTRKNPSRERKREKKNSRILFFFFFRLHTLLPSPSSLSLSSQRHKDIFILHKARTLMKHRRHKYISMIFFFFLSNLAPTAAAVTHFSISVCCCEHKLSECMRVKITPSISVNVTHLKIV